MNDNEKCYIFNNNNNNNNNNVLKVSLLLTGMCIFVFVSAQLNKKLQIKEMYHNY